MNLLPIFTLKIKQGIQNKRMIIKRFLFLFLCTFFLSFFSGDICTLALSTQKLSASTDTLSLVDNNQTEKQTNSDSSAIITSGHGLSVSFTYGFDNSCKYGRQINLFAEVTNTAEDFNGTIGILCTSNVDNGDTLYEIPCVIASGETKKLELTAPISSNNWPSLLIKDEKEQVIIQKYFRVTMTTDNTIVFLGVLSDDTNDFSYISSTGLAKLFLFDETNLPSTADGLDSLDILMISNFNTDRLSKEQINAILQWTNQGGMLVFGTGSTATKTLSAFQESIFNGTIGDVEKRTTLLGMSEEELLALKTDLYNSINQPLDYDEAALLEEAAESSEILEQENTNTTEAEKSEESVFTERISQKEIDSLTLESMPKDMISLELENFFPILSEDDGFNLIIKNNYGNGTILVAAFELGMKAKYSNSMGTQLYHIIENNFSETKYIQLNEDLFFNSFYSLSRVLNANEQVSYPHLKLYFIILLVYAIITGPILYFILKKLDKRHLLWLIMPISCFICTVIIYFIGSSTRITEPFIRYVSYFEIEQAENAEETPAYSQDVYFNVTAPYNKKYSIPLTNVSNVEILDNQYYGYSYDIEEPASSSYYKTAIYKDGNKDTTLIMNDYAAFHAASFHCTSTEETNLSGNFDTNLELKEDFTVTGTLTNHLGIDLYQAVYICNGQLYILGNMKDGDTVSLENCDVSVLNPAHNVESSYTASGIETLEAIAGCNGWSTQGTVFERQLFFAYDYYLRWDSSLLTEGNRIIAVAENGTVGFLQDTGLSTSGLQMFDIHVSPAEFDNNIIETLDDNFVSVLDGNTSELPLYRYMYGTATISYQIPQPETVHSLAYQKSGNAEFNSNQSNYNSSFNGTILAYNIFTGEYDELFYSGIAGSCEDLSPYLSANGQIILRYQNDDPAAGDSDNIIPLLYLIRSE